MIYLEFVSLLCGHGIVCRAMYYHREHVLVSFPVDGKKLLDTHNVKEITVFKLVVSELAVYNVLLPLLQV